MPRVLFPEWRAENEPTKYPFADRATLRTAGGLAVGPDTFLDAALYPVGGGAGQYLSRVVVAPRRVAVVVGDPRAPALASSEFDPLAPPDLLELTDPLGRPAGVLVSEAARLAAFQAWPAGTHAFAPAATEFCASCVTPVPAAGVRGFATPDGELFTGDVWLVGEDGVVLSADAGGAVRLDVVGDPLFRRRLCQPVELFSTPRFVRTVNGMRPDAAGDFKITVDPALAADTVLRVYRAGDGLTVEAVGQPLGEVR